MNDEQESEDEGWLLGLSRTRADLKIAAAVVLAFFAYKDLALMTWLVVLFLLLLALTRLAGWILGKGRSSQTDPKARESDALEEHKPLDSD
jgi:hypothetical protein